MSEQKFDDLPSDNVSLLAWELSQFPASDRGTLMRDAICLPDRDVHFSDIEGIRIHFDDYWQEIFGVGAPLRELGFYVAMLSTPETERHFRKLNESVTQEDIDVALQHILIHLHDRVLQVRQFRMN